MSQNAVLSQSESTSSYTGDFIILSLKLVAFGKKAGVDITPFRDEKLPLFSQLPSKVQSQVIEHLTSKVDCLELAETEGKQFRSNKQMLWHTLVAMGLTPCSDVFDKITDEDVIEIHSLGNDILQIYHSFSFYDKTSYTLEELCSIDWQELYITDDMTTVNLLNMASKVSSGEYGETFDPDFPNYIVQEKNSALGYKIEIEYKFGSPLFDKAGTPVACLSVEGLSVLNKRPDTESEMFEKHFEDKGPASLNLV